MKFVLLHILKRVNPPQTHPHTQKYPYPPTTTPTLPRHGATAAVCWWWPGRPPISSPLSPLLCSPPSGLPANPCRATTAGCWWGPGRRMQRWWRAPAYYQAPAVLNTTAPAPPLAGPQQLGAGGGLVAGRSAGGIGGPQRKHLPVEPRHRAGGGAVQGEWRQDYCEWVVPFLLT